MTIDGIVTTIRRRLAEHGSYLATFHRERDVDGYLEACRMFDIEMAGYARKLVDIVGETEKAREHARTQAEWESKEKECAQLRAWLVEALDLFQSAWCPEWGHAPKPEQLERAEELRKLATDVSSTERRRS